MSPQDADAIIFGRNPVYEALRAGRSLNRILIAKGVFGRDIQAITALARTQGVVYQFVDRRQLDTRAGGAHQGVVALTAERAYAELEDVIAVAWQRPAPPFLVVLDGIQDPHNLGAVIRTADAVGAHGVVIPRRHAAGMTATVAKASAGAVEYVPVARVANLNQVMQALKAQGFWLIGLEVDGTEAFDAVDYTVPVALVIGGEDRGLRPLVRRGCDHVVRLPIGGHTGSLNAGVAAALLMYEVFRQRRAGQNS